MNKMAKNSQDTTRNCNTTRRLYSMLMRTFYRSKSW